MSELRSTAITTSAPIARASDTGTGLTRPPSTSIRPSCTTGVNRAGSAMEARTASMVEPSRSQTSAPVSSAVATAAKGMCSSSIGRSTKLRRKNSIRRSPLIMPPFRCHVHEREHVRNAQSEQPLLEASPARPRRRRRPPAHRSMCRIPGPAGCRPAPGHGSRRHAPIRAPSHYLTQAPRAVCVAWSCAAALHDAAEFTLTRHAMASHPENLSLVCTVPLDQYLRPSLSSKIQQFVLSILDGQIQTLNISKIFS